jgi:uncharacterized protein (DUF488 family)
LAGLLKLHGIDLLVDVRSVPYSRYNPQYNRENIKAFLVQNGIAYVFMGASLGARYQNRELYFSDRETADFRKVRETAVFKRGIEKIINGIRKGRKTCLLCSEKDPFDCHRFVLVAYALVKKGVDVRHILEKGELISNDILEERLLQKYKIEYGRITLFGLPVSKEEAIDEAYERRNRDIGREKIGTAINVPREDLDEKVFT